MLRCNAGAAVPSCPTEHRSPGRERTPQGKEEQGLEGDRGDEQVEEKARSPWAWGTGFLQIRGCEKAAHSWGLKSHLCQSPGRAPAEGTRWGVPEDASG